MEREAIQAVAHLVKVPITETMMGIITHRYTLSHQTALLHTSRPTKLPHVLAVLAGATLLPAAASTVLAPHPSAPHGREGRSFGGSLNQRLVESGARARPVNHRGRRCGRLVP